MKEINNNTSALFQIIVSFLVLYLATMVVIFIPDFESDFIRFSLLSSLFIISFLFQFYILDYKIKEEKKHKKQLERLLSEQDRTARMLIRRDRALSEANERLREMDVLKSEFVSVAAHQMRTPLSGIKWSLDMIAKEMVGPINVKQKRLLLKSYESNERMIALVNNLLNTDRIESGKTKLELVNTNLKNIIDNVLYYIYPQATSRDITVNVSYDNKLPTVDVDQEKIREVIQNILENAVKYSNKGGIIDISTYIENEFLVISIKDNGIGIPENFKRELFSKFSRGNNAVKIKTEGSGLGLFVANEIVKMHHGTITFESEEGSGTTFFVSIPIKKKFQENNN